MSSLFLENWTRTKAKVDMFHSKATNALDMGVSMSGDSTFAGLFNPSLGKYTERYSQFRGWLYAAINAIAMEAAGQPTFVGILDGSASADNERSSLNQTKSLTYKERRQQQRRVRQLKAQRAYYWKKMPSAIQRKAAAEEWSILEGHPFNLVIEQPNPNQTRWQFTYMFIANLILTGWGYVVGGATEGGGFEMYAVPTTWLTPIYKEGQGLVGYKLQNPAKSHRDGGSFLAPENVACAYLPNPADPLGALAPAGAQSTSIKIDEHIQTSQLLFFQNGVFPSVIVTVGKDPHPDAPGGGTRPRLSGEQRRQVIGAIRKAMSSVANYGNPAIVDGLIEKIERLSATSNEMGWDKSEDKIRNRILSAFGVHPFILGEPLNVGGYAQATEIKQRFFKRVNSYLELLSLTVTNFSSLFATQTKERLVVWWEPCDAIDPTIRFQNLREARKNGDISENEFRAELGFSPNEEAETDRSPILDNPQAMSIYVQIATGVRGGSLDRDGAAYALSEFFQIELEEALEMLGEPEEDPEDMLPSSPEELDSADINSDMVNEDGMDESIRTLARATSALEAVVQSKELATYVSSTTTDDSL